jgi:hypothetical protein
MPGYHPELVHGKLLSHYFRLIIILNYKFGNQDLHASSLRSILLLAIAARYSDKASNSTCRYNTPQIAWKSLDHSKEDLIFTEGNYAGD